MTEVHVGLKYVRNLGNFESAHIDIGVTDEVRPVDGEGQRGVENAFNRIYGFVEDKLQAKVLEIDAELTAAKTEVTRKGK